MNATKFRLRKIWYYDSVIQGKLGDVQTYLGTLFEVAKAANVKNLEEIEKSLKEAYQHVAEAKRLAKAVVEKMEKELTGE
jgi:uncharacterized protein YdbL (DUF1318 family)